MPSNDDPPGKPALLQRLFPTRRQEHDLREQGRLLRHQPILKDPIPILQSGSFPHQQTQNLDRNCILKLIISAPLPTSSNRPYASNAASFIDIRRHESPRSISERKVRFVEFVEPNKPLIHSRMHAPPPRLGHATPTKTRTVARVSISTGKLYYTEEPIPEWRISSTSFSPPPPSSPRSHPLLSRRTSQYPPGLSTHPYLQFQRADNRRRFGASTSSTQSGNSLYESAWERFLARWGVFTFKMHFRMFRAQDKMKSGVAWVGGVVRRMRTRRQG